jgi:hypothetical protein
MQGSPRGGGVSRVRLKGNIGLRQFRVRDLKKLRAGAL